MNIVWDWNVLTVVKVSYQVDFRTSISEMDSEDPKGYSQADLLDGLPDDNKAYSHYIEPTARERQYHGACFNGSPHDLGVKGGEHSENSKWRCALVNKKRKNADRPREFVCFPQCMAWTKQKQTSNPDSFAGCRLHAPITNRKHTNIVFQTFVD